MPTIAWFYGIAIQMFYDDHNPPHLHARYGRARALVRLSDGETIAGELPPLATRMVRAWALARRAEFVVIPRPGVVPEPLPAPFRGRALQGFPLGVSASQIRARVKAGLPVTWLTGATVAEMIRNNRLYL